jgi:hypothetical protein
MAKKRNPGKRRDRRQARDESFLRYNPERSTLVSLIGESRSQQKSDVKSARKGARMISRSAKRSAKPLDRIYTNAASRASAVQSAINTDLQKLGPVASSLVAAANSGLQTTGQSLQGERARVAREVAGRRSGAVAAGESEVRNIRAQGASDRAKTIDRLVQNEREAGTYASSRYGELRGERADRRVTIRGQNVTKRGQTLTAKGKVKDRTSRENIAAADRQSREQIAKAKANAKTKKSKLNPNQKNTAIDNISAAREAFNQYKGQKGFDPKGLRNGLLVGSLPTGDGKSIKVPTVKSSIEVTAGFELAQRGHLTAKTERELRKRGYRIPKSWQRGKLTTPVGPFGTGHLGP